MVSFIYDYLNIKGFISQMHIKCVSYNDIQKLFFLDIEARNYLNRVYGY